MADASTPPSVAITRGLQSSVKTFTAVRVADVEAYLAKGACYEVTLPTEADPTRTANRVYVDLDGKAPDLTRDAFEALVTTLLAALHTILQVQGDGGSLMSACKWRGWKKGDVANILSFRLTLTKRHGTHAAVKAFVLSTLAPRIAAAVGALIPFHIDTEGAVGPCLQLDTSVYSRGRKMRMLRQSKAYKHDGRWVDEQRPFELVGGGTVSDTLITLIPADSVPLPEPSPLATTTRKRRSSSREEPARSRRKEEATGATGTGDVADAAGAEQH